MADETGVRRRSAFQWVLIDGNRLLVAGALLGGILALLLALLAANLFPRAPGEPLYLLISVFLGGNLTLITVVIAINQLVFSRELSSPGDLERRTRKAVEYRDQVQEVMDRAVSPVMPGSFLLELHDNLGKRAQALRETVTEPDDGLAAEIDELAGALRSDVRDVTRALDTPAADEQIFGAIAATLGTTQAKQLYDISRVETEYADRLSDEQRELLESIREHLLHIDVARKYFRTVYITKELSFLSRVLLIVGLPAQLFLAATLVALVACFAPLSILASFVLRLSWVAQRNATVMPFAASEKDYTLFSSGR